MEWRDRVDCDLACISQARRAQHSPHFSEAIRLHRPLRFVDLNRIDLRLENAYGWRGADIVKSVLFVCTGNICRSPIAEGLFRQLIGNRKDIEVASAGVHAVRGQPPSLYAVEVCEANGVDISGLRSQPLTGSLVERATHIFAMTGAHLETIHLLFPKGAEKSYLLREF